MGHYSNKSPVFIVGCHRSGTTLMRVMLSSHPNVYISEETGFIPWAWPRLESFSPLEKDENLLRLCRGLNAFLFAEKWSGIPAPRQVLENVEKRTFQEIVRYYASYNAPEPPKIWGDNTPAYVSSMFLLRDIFPEAGFVNMVRDGRDVVASAEELGLGGFNRYARANEWNERIASAVLFERVHPDKIVHVRYEDLVKAPEKELGRVCAFLGIEFDEGMLEFHRREFSRDMGKHAHHVNLSRPVNDTAVGRSRKEYSPTERRELERFMGAGLTVFGYPLENAFQAFPSSVYRFKAMGLNALSMLASPSFYRIALRRLSGILRSKRVR